MTRCRQSFWAVLAELVGYCACA